MNKQKVVITRSTGIVDDSRTIKLAKELCSLGYDVDVLGWDRKNQHASHETIEVGDGVINISFFKQPSVYGSGLKNIFKLLKFQKWLKNNLKKYLPKTIVHACDYDTGNPALKVCKKKDFKLVYDIFDFYTDCHKIPFGLGKFIRKQEIKVINNADCTIICTEQRVEQIKGSKPKKVVVIHNTPKFDLDIQNRQENKNLKVCFIGALLPDRLIGEILQEIPNNKIDFVFGGNGPFEDEINKLAQNNSNVEYVGQQPYDKVLEIENGCDVLFATYNPEINNHKFSAPNKFYEAGCLSKPIIVCKNTGIDKLVKEYNTGLVCDYSAKDFFEKLNELNNNKDLIKELGKNGLIAYNNNFSWEIMKERIKSVYCSLSEG